jgi:murein DD-endopeptidase MepM/ murein hydrolase activator NlpD
MNMRRFASHALTLGLTMAAAATVSCARPADRDQLLKTGDILIPLDPNIIQARVPRHATLETLLRQHDVRADLAAALVGSVRTVFNPRQLRANQVYQLSRTIDGIINEFRYDIDGDRFLRARRNASGSEPAFDVAVVAIPKELVVDAVGVSVSRERPSLVGALDVLGESVPLALSLAGIFGGVIDFNSDLQPGDAVEVLFDRAVRYGEPAGYGDVRAAVLLASGRRQVAIRFETEPGRPGYYDENGRSLKRQFRATPLPFDPRITSRFSYRRLHPVHGRVRPHLGVDYGAPTGTPVYAAAAGVVEFAGWNGEAGRMVRLRHAGGYQTLYLHLSAIPAGIRPGVRVKQDDRIGSVGMTGSATGPHLDYRIIRNGVYVNPLEERKRMPPGDPIPAARLAEFQSVRDRVMSDLRARLGAAQAATAAAPGAGAPGMPAPPRATSAVPNGGRD